MTEYETGVRERSWYRIDEPPTGVTTVAQEVAIRLVAEEFGYETLRGFHMYLKSQGWDYYDILEMYYGE